MAISPYYNDAYDGMRYYEEQERKYRAERARQQMMAMQGQYCINTDTYGGMPAQQMQEAQKPIKAAQPEYMTNKNLLLLGEAP